MRNCIIGVDPGFANLGLAVVRLGSTHEQDEVISISVFRTEKSNKKSNVYASDDMMRRTHEVATTLSHLRLVYENEIAAVCMESLSFPRNASSSAKIGLTCGAVVSVFRKWPVLQVLPQVLKLRVCGNKSASKGDIQNALDARFLHVPKKILTDNGVALTYREHAYDALGAIVGCMESDLIRMIRGRGDDG